MCNLVSRPGRNFDQIGFLLSEQVLREPLENRKTLSSRNHVISKLRPLLFFYSGVSGEIFFARTLRYFEIRDLKIRCVKGSRSLA